MTLLLVLAAITLIFGVWLALKSLSGWRICAICLAVSTVWVGLLAAYHGGWFDNPVLVALLMGQSIAGLYYLAEKHAPRAWLIFRLPALLSLTYLFYVALTAALHGLAGLLLAALWVVFSGIYLLQTKPGITRAAKKLIECCGNW